MDHRTAALLILTVGAAFSRAALAGVPGTEACDALAALKLPDTTIEKAEAVATGPYEYRVGPGSTRTTDLPGHCRVVGTIRPTPDSAIGFEVWLPAAHWNGKYRQEGNGALAGFIDYRDLIGDLKAGYAAASTDDGHRATAAGGFDANWALGHPEKIIDYGSRAVHRSALAAEAIVAAYYGRRARFAYFVGCSDGGRESLMEAQRYPADFDGYLAGSPGIDIPNNGLAHLYLAKTLLSLGADEQLTTAQLKALSTRALERCDAKDGVKDGVLRDPRRCDFKPQELVCRGGQDGTCLTAAQAAAVQRVYDGLKDPTTGAQLAPGWRNTLGTEFGTWPPMLQFGATQNYLDVLLYGRSEPDVAALDLTQAARDTKSSLGPTINSDSRDLRSARSAGKKILQFHGWPDNAVLAQYSVDYFEAVQKYMGPTGDFYRLFMVPGMAHCSGGIGPTIYADGPDGPDAFHEWVAALEAWVEHGKAPDRIIATEYDTAGVPLDPLGGGVMSFPAGRSVKSTRPVCPYPEVAVFTGRGSADRAANFACRHP
jgi:Tannase and feruloyl esterase